MAHPTLDHEQGDGRCPPEAVATQPCPPPAGPASGLGALVEVFAGLWSVDVGETPPATGFDPRWEDG